MVYIASCLSTSTPSVFGTDCIDAAEFHTLIIGGIKLDHRDRCNYFQMDDKAPRRCKL